MTFANTAVDINAGTSFYAKGFFAPLLKSNLHILFALAGMTNDPPIVTMDDAAREISEAKAHLDYAPAATPEQFSTAGYAKYDKYKALIVALQAEWYNWSSDTQTDNLRLTAAAAADLMASLDWEFVGIPVEESDPGTSY